MKNKRATLINGASYSEKLKDPRWQKLRLEVMERQQFKCQRCGAEEKTLNVHHRYYTKGAEPWEYDQNSLECLCEECHEKIEEILTLVRRTIAPWSTQNMDRLLGNLMAASDDCAYQSAIIAAMSMIHAIHFSSVNKAFQEAKDLILHPEI